MNNTPDYTPDDATLTLWMDGELDGDALARVETWAADHPEILAERAAVQEMRSAIQTHVPGNIEPPYADFFNQRILRHIHDEMPAPARAPSATVWQRLGRWLAIPATAAAMAVCFYVGTQVGHQQPSAPAYTAAETAPAVYTPDNDVRAAMFQSEDADATVIVLEGLEDIPDHYDIVGEPRRSRPNTTGTVMVSSHMTL